MTELAKLMQQYVEHHSLHELEGIAETAIPGVWFYRSGAGNQRRPFIYQSGIIILGQGQKNIHIGPNPVQYGPNDYLVVGCLCPLSVKRLSKPVNHYLG